MLHVAVLPVPVAIAVPPLLAVAVLLLSGSPLPAMAVPPLVAVAVLLVPRASANPPLTVVAVLLVPMALTTLPAPVAVAVLPPEVGSPVTPQAQLTTPPFLATAVLLLKKPAFAWLPLVAMALLPLPGSPKPAAAVLPLTATAMLGFELVDGVEVAVLLLLGEPCVTPLMDTDAPWPDGVAHAVGAPTASATSGAAAVTAMNPTAFLIGVSMFSVSKLVSTTSLKICGAWRNATLKAPDADLFRLDFQRVASRHSDVAGPDGVMPPDQ